MSTTSHESARIALEEYCRRDAEASITGAQVEGDMTGGHWIRNAEGREVGYFEVEVAAASVNFGPSFISSAMPPGFVAWEAEQDPFAFFYLPETDPTGAIAQETDAPDVAGSREVPCSLDGWTAYHGLEAAYVRDYGMGRRRWSVCPGRAPELATNPTTGLPWTLEEMADGWKLRDEPCTFKPMVRVVRGKETIGRLPQRGLDPSAGAHHFRVWLPQVATTEWRGEDGASREAPMAVRRDFVLLYEVLTPDDGWTYERVLDAGDIPLALLGLVPGWQDPWDSGRYRK